PRDREGIMRRVEEQVFARISSAGERGQRLFACACCRRVEGWLTDERSRQAIEVAERFAERLALREELLEAHRAARDVLSSFGGQVDREVPEVLPWQTGGSRLLVVGGGLVEERPVLDTLAVEHSFRHVPEEVRRASWA